jgi:tetratricopeptide (TPR) repeat protein
MASAYPFNLGSHSRAISTNSREAQHWFNRGLNWCFGFHHEEAVRCFQRALQFDPGCVMAHWGVAYASGPFYNLAWREFGVAEATAATLTASTHLAQARVCFADATDIEMELVEALAWRFQAPHPVSPEQYDRWDTDYAAALRRVHHRHPHDRDVMALLAEALITRTPRRLWDIKTGRPARDADVLEALALCEQAIAMEDAQGPPPHPAICHMHIHILEMSNAPERALRSADTLAHLCPDAGHMTHMPGHIYALCGQYEKARAVSERAIAADDKYAAYDDSVGFYITARAHDLHLLMSVCMLAGQYGPALAAADKMQRLLTRDIIAVQGRPKLAMTTEGYVSMRMHVLVRFGRWHDILEVPPPAEPDLYPVTTAMHHYARGVASASLKRIEQAEAERVAFQAALRRVPAGRRYLSNPAVAILGVAEKMLDGELEYHKGNIAAAFGHLFESVRRDDDLGYTEPWAWMHPPRHALAALLAEQGHYPEAEAVYRDDLGLSDRVQRCAQHPNNVWALHGLAECLERRADRAEFPDIKQQLAVALAKADVPITASCLCRTTTQSCCA